MNVATPPQELYDRIARLGWSVKKVDLKNGSYVARGVGPAGEKVERTGRTPEHAVAALLQFAVRSNEIRRYARHTFAAWTENWIDQSEQIAAAYSKLASFDEKAVPAWKALASESQIQADAIRKQISVEVTDEPEPYASSEEMCEDVHKNRHLSVSRANATHPVWTEDQVVDFRIVHDVLGHCQSGGGFTWVGANQATAAHMPLLTPLAREALFVEAIASLAYSKHFKGYSNQKVALMSDFLHPVQDGQGEHIHVPHGGTPQIDPASLTAPAVAPDAPNVTAQDWMSPHQYRPIQLTHASFEGTEDPNHNWQHGLDLSNAPTVNPSDPDATHLDYIDLLGALKHAHDLSTDWSEEDPATQRQAIVNAFRASLLGDRKHPMWQAAHYQAIMHHRPEASSFEMWDAIEHERERHNRAMGHRDPHSGLRYVLAEKLRQRDPDLSKGESHVAAQRMLHQKIREFENLVGRQDEDEGTRHEGKRHGLARKMVKHWLNSTFGRTALHHAPTDEFNNDEWRHFEPRQDEYGSHMAHHLDLAELVGKHIHELQAAALKDVEHGGKGHIFRNAALKIVPSLDPSTVGLAWRLLRPLSSELAHDDPHALRALHVTGQTPVRDFYKHERMLHALKDASGYRHVPMGLFQIGLDNAVRHPGEEHPHAPLRVLDPHPWHDPNLDYPTATSSQRPWEGPHHVEALRTAPAQVAVQFEDEFAGYPRDQIPSKRSSRISKVVPVRHLALSEKEKFKKLKSKLHLEARRFGQYAALQVRVTEEQFAKFLKEQRNKGKISTNYADEAASAFDRMDDNTFGIYVPASDWTVT